MIEYNLLPAELNIGDEKFIELWSMRPVEDNYVMMYGKKIITPRKFKVYGKQYNFNGTCEADIEIPPILKSYLDYINSLDSFHYNSVLVNWYENADYIGFHSDNEKQLVAGSNIYGISFGEKRTMRFKDNDETIDFIL